MTMWVGVGVNDGKRIKFELEENHGVQFVKDNEKENLRCVTINKQRKKERQKYKDKQRKF